MKLNKEELKKDIEVVVALAEKYHDIVWEPQEMQKDHIDNIGKAERVAIIGIYNDIVNLKSALLQYEHWFSDEQFK